MKYYNSKRKAEAAGLYQGTLIGVCIYTVAAFVLAWIFSIEEGKEYGWFAGIWHGTWWPQNLIISFFKSGWYAKAPIHTTMYSIMWWLWAIGTVFYYLGSIAKIRKCHKEMK